LQNLGSNHLTLRLPLTIAAGLGLVFLAGCPGPAKEPVYPVKGKVFYRDKPCAGAVVWFYPADAAEATRMHPNTDTRPNGVVQEDGSFEMSTHGTKDGAPAGRYRVTVMWTKSVPGKGRGEGAEENLLPLRYMDPEKAGLPVVEVKELKGGVNELPPFNLVP
jgi:hypothetical protein